MKGLVQVIAGPEPASFVTDGADLDAHTVHRRIPAALAARGLAHAGLHGTGKARQIDPETGTSAEDTWIFLRFGDDATGWTLQAGRWNTAGNTIKGHRGV